MHIMEVAVHPALYSLNISFADQLRIVLTNHGHSVAYHDLYRDSFDPVLQEEEIRRGFSFDPKVLSYQKELQKSEGLLILHPDWWGQPPALLKGWLDRVLSPGIAYRFEGQEFEEKKRIGLLNGKSALVVVTSDNVQNQQHWSNLWKDWVFHYCGIAESEVLLIDHLRDRQQGEIAELMEEYKNKALDFFRGNLQNTG